ncbi:hypothetical protein EDM55_09165 [Brevibacillus centrosporus]|nr:hypothetical protein EDM55_09165 [Brevibacillus centrosporus]
MHGWLQRRISFRGKDRGKREPAASNLFPVFFKLSLSISLTLQRSIVIEERVPLPADSILMLKW